MPLYSFKAKDAKGKLVEDILQAASRSDAASILKAESLQILTIKSVDQGFGKVIGGRISIAEKAAFCRFVATMLRAGLPVNEALDIMKDESKNPKLKKIVMDMSFQVRKGSTLSSVLAKYERDFGTVFLTIIKAGEESGTLEKSFDYLSKQLLESHDLSQKVKGALMYPAVIVAAMFANFLVMLIFVLPKLAEVFTQLNVPLPAFTKMVLDFGNFVGDNTLLVIGAVLVFVLFLVLIMVIPFSKKAVVNLFLTAPVVKSITNQLDVARFSQTLATLLKSGVPIMVALDVSSDTLTQPALRKKSKEFSQGVAQGESLSDILMKGKGIFPSTVIQTIKAGEKSGSLEVVLGELSDFYQKEVEYSLKRFTSLLEPVLLLIIGIAVGGMVILMITPIYNLVGGLEGQF